MELAERLWRRIERTPSGCWEWTGYRMPTGYGMLRVGSATDGSRRTAYTHRLMYELLVEPIPADLQIDHLCRNRACCNPSHLEPVTAFENSRRGRDARDKCSHGHIYDEVGVYWTTKGFRQCRACMRERDSQRWADRRARQNALRNERYHASKVSS